jgi:isopentenyl-diphosphate delta-isomerase
VINQRTSQENKKDLLILVDDSDKELGYKSKSECHQGEGSLHRAFSVFIFDNLGQLLIQKRASNKPLWDLHWSNSCCSHPYKDEDMESAVKRRLKEELNIECPVHYLYKFIYHAKYKNVGSEHELCHVYVGLFDGEIKANPEEIDDWKFVKSDELEDSIRNSRENYTPWMKIEWETINNTYKNDLKNILGLEL